MRLRCKITRIETQNFASLRQNNTTMTDLFNNKYRIATARATWHDYKDGSYFITVCTKNRKFYFGQIMNREMVYSDLGRSAIDCLEQIPSHFPHVEIPVFVVMPNHIHAIIIINALAPTAVETQNLAFAHSVVETQNFASLQRNGSKQKFGPQSKNLASVVRGFKIGVTKYANNHDISFAWQPRFHDHIIRNQHEMNHIANYIDTNVIRWKEDCYNNPVKQQIVENIEKPYLQYL